MARHKRSAQQVRIIGGKWKGRKLRFQGDDTLRPTLGRVRETLFNWLRPHIRNMHCLDAFAGSGILGFEALSQGASDIVLVERQADCIRGLKTIVQELGVNAQTSIVKADTLAYLRRTDEVFDLIFLDPPFAHPQLLAETLELIAQRQLLRQYLYAEARNAQHITEPAERLGFTVEKQTRAGDSVGLLLAPSADIAAAHSQG